MREIMESIARSRQVKVDVQPCPRYTARTPPVIRLERMREQSDSERHLLGKAQAWWQRAEKGTQSVLRAKGQGGEVSF